MFNQHTKFAVYKITCNEDIKGNAKCKNSRFEPPFGRLKSNVHGSPMARWIATIANWTFFRQLLRLGRYEQILVEIDVFETGVSIWV